MKPNLPTTLIFLAVALAARAQEPVPPSASTSPSPVPSTSTAAPAPPVVRLPVPSPAGAVSTAPVPAPGTTATGAPLPTPPVTTEPGAAQLGWSGEGVGLRSSAPTNLRTNRSFETRGSVPRLVRPPRRTFGGFMAGFANLFNPFAPTGDGVAQSAVHHYDGEFHRAPLPSSFRDERSHEASAILFSTPLESDPTEPRTKKSTSASPK